MRCLVQINDSATGCYIYIDNGNKLPSCIKFSTINEIESFIEFLSDVKKIWNKGID